MSISIRKMQQTDITAALELLGQYNMAPQPENPNAERSVLGLCNSFIAESTAGIIGVASYIVLDKNTAETASLAVHPNYRGQGIGFLLQNARLEEMRALGIRTVRTESDRAETIEWYIKKFGYRCVGTNPKKHVFSLPEIDHWTVLELEL